MKTTVLWCLALPLVCIASTTIAAPGDLIMIINDPNSADGTHRFGATVATLGNQAVISSPGDAIDGNGAGAIYLFDSLTGNQQMRLKNPAVTGHPTDFGGSLATLGSDVYVGATTAGRTALVQGTGAAYRFSSATGTLLTTYPSPPQFSPFGNRFGSAIVPSNSALLIGEPGYDTGPTATGKQNVGAVRSITAGTTITRVTPTVGEGLGKSLASNGSRLLAGAPNNSTSADNAGAAYLFDILTGAQLQAFTSPNPRKNEFFGWNVAIHDNNAFIGAPNMGSTGPNYAGAVYMFDLTSGAVLHTFLDPDPGNDWFGESLAIVGDQLLIGAPADSNTTSRGRAFLFDLNDFSLLHTFVDPTLSTAGGFGTSVAGFNNGNYLIGADGGGGNRAGMAFVFSAVPEPGALPLALGSLVALLSFARWKGYTSRHRKCDTTAVP